MGKSRQKRRGGEGEVEWPEVVSVKAVNVPDLLVCDVKNRNNVID